MRIAACILLVSLIAFDAEAIKLPFTCTEIKKIETHACCKMKCPYNPASSKSEQQNPKPGDCNSSAKCVDCPLCAVFAGAQLSDVPFQLSTVIQEYSIPQNHQLADYFSQQWKPPNIA